MRKCGYVAIMGRVNAGKSSLLNACLQTKISGVSKKPHTTRTRILGIATHEESQILFIDTPGLLQFKGKSPLDPLLRKHALSVLADSDLILYLVDIARGLTEDDIFFLGKVLDQNNARVLICLSKSDLRKKFEIKDASKALQEKIAEMTAGLSSNPLISDKPYILSAKNAQNVEELKKYLADNLPEGEWLFNEEELTDLSTKRICEELIRESLFRSLGEEIPYQCNVVVEALEDQPEITRIQAMIYVVRKTQKPILIGKGGSKIKEIGMHARESIEKLLQKKVFLSVDVGVDEKWMERWVQQELDQLKQ
jgi:GTPase